MKIREATKDDLDQMVTVDVKAYSKYGCTKEYFSDKLSSFPGGVLVVEENGNITGFTILEKMKKDGVPQDFRDLKLTEPIRGNWIHIVAFTTATNYLDVESDSKLLAEAEKIAINEGYIEACVPLSKDHPFADNDVFKFYDMNGYDKIGEIKWIASPTELIDCYFYRKKLV